MADLTQFLLLTAIFALTATLVVVGYQVYHILKDFRATLRKVDRILDDVSAVAEDIRRPVHVASSLTSGLEFITKIVDMVRSDKHKKDEEDDSSSHHLEANVSPVIVEEGSASADDFVSTDVMPPHINRVQSQGRRFFFKKKNV